MWHRLKNFVSSFSTYDDLSPDVNMRQQVNQRLQDRPALNSEEWFESFYKSNGISPAIAAFAYTHLAEYSELDFSRVLPSDRLEEDLHWTNVCWFDWDLSLCDDFYHHFKIDISDTLADFNFVTIEEFVSFLNCQCNG
ncbi:MAG: hypothetical protein HC769_10930 [Cyanobacteria bacterium CRU_2_1]|nr:hypothetical protein [Hydrococcus sp. RU_2_2]NJR59310.1 hypothetical protein [Cyanobacteria bacterium CRU_2_1]